MFSYKSKILFLTFLLACITQQAWALNYLFSDLRRTQVEATTPKGIVVKEFTSDMTYDGFVALSSRNTVGQIQFLNNAFRFIENPETLIDTMLTPPIASSPLSLAMTDLDSDRDLDLLVTTGNDSSLLWCRNDGFTNGKMNLVLRNNFITSNGFPQNITLVDLNADSREDMLLPNSEMSFQRIMNQGDGTIGGGSEFAGNTPISSAVGDFNGDGHMDVAVTNSGSNNVSVLFGASGGSGSLTRNANYPSDNSLTQAWGIQSADVNGDGHLDLIVTSRGANTLTVLAGDAMGRFSVLSSAPTCQQPTNLVLGDFNHDSRRDAAVICVGDGKLRILVGDGAGHFSTTALQPDITLGANPYDILTGDFNRDGKDDLLVSVTGANRLVTLLGNTPPSLSEGSFDSATGVFSVVFSDIDNDLPNPISVSIDGGAAQVMSEALASDVTTTDGKTYHFTPTNLSAGSHNYQFSASDGLHTAVTMSANLSLDRDISPAPAKSGCSLNAKSSSNYLPFISLMGVALLAIRRRMKV